MNLFKRAIPGIFFIFVFLQQFYGNIVDFGGVRIRFIRVEGEHVDHLTTTAAHLMMCLYLVE